MQGRSESIAWPWPVICNAFTSSFQAGHPDHVCETMAMGPLWWLGKPSHHPLFLCLSLSSSNQVTSEIVSDKWQVGSSRFSFVFLMPHHNQQWAPPCNLGYDATSQGKEIFVAEEYSTRRCIKMFNKWIIMVCIAAQSQDTFITTHIA